MTRNRTLLAALVAFAVLALPAGASAGQWVQVSCQNSDGSGSNAQGWSGSATEASAYGLEGSTCGAGQPLQEYLSGAPIPTNTFEDLGYTPPAGSALAGGSLTVSGYAGGYGTNAYGAIAFFSPRLVWPGNAFLTCNTGGPFSACPSTRPSFTNDTVSLPSNAGGGVDLQIGCDGAAGASCSQGANGAGYLVHVQLISADLLLSNASAPAGTDFSGTILAPAAHKTAHLLFTATDANGPGVYNVTAAVNGQQVYAATPNDNDGECVSHGTYPGTGAMEFDYAQPCLQTLPVDVPVDTTKLPDGSNELTVTVTDAAGNTATVYDGYITTSNPVTTPAPKHRKGVKQVAVRFKLAWSWKRRVTTLRSIAPATAWPAGAELKIGAGGPHHPRFRHTHEPARRAGVLFRELEAARFAAGDTLDITVTARGRRAERIRATIPGTKLPGLKLL